MLERLTQQTINEYASDEGSLKEQPTGDDYTLGVKVGKTVPAKWWNWLFSAATKRVMQARQDSASMLTELQNVVTDASITLNAANQHQLSEAIDYKTDKAVERYVDKKAYIGDEWNAVENESKQLPLCSVWKKDISGTTNLGGSTQSITAFKNGFLVRATDGIYYTEDGKTIEKTFTFTTSSVEYYITCDSDYAHIISCLSDGSVYHYSSYDGISWSASERLNVTLSYSGYLNYRSVSSYGDITYVCNRYIEDNSAATLITVSNVTMPSSNYTIGISDITAFKGIGDSNAKLYGVLRVVQNGKKVNDFIVKSSDGKSWAAIEDSAYDGDKTIEIRLYSTGGSYLARLYQEGSAQESSRNINLQISNNPLSESWQTVIDNDTLGITYSLANDTNKKWFTKLGNTYIVVAGDYSSDARDDTSKILTSTNLTTWENKAVDIAHMCNMHGHEVKIINGTAIIDYNTNSAYPSTSKTYWSSDAINWYPVSFTDSVRGGTVSEEWISSSGYYIPPSPVCACYNSVTGVTIAGYVHPVKRSTSSIVNYYRLAVTDLNICKVYKDAEITDGSVRYKRLGVVIYRNDKLIPMSGFALNNTSVITLGDYEFLYYPLFLDGTDDFLDYDGYDNEPITYVYMYYKPTGKCLLSGLGNAYKIVYNKGVYACISKQLSPAGVHYFDRGYPYRSSLCFYTTNPEDSAWETVAIPTISESVQYFKDIEVYKDYFILLRCTENVNSTKQVSKITRLEVAFVTKDMQTFTSLNASESYQGLSAASIISGEGKLIIGEFYTTSDILVKDYTVTEWNYTTGARDTGSPKQFYVGGMFFSLSGGSITTPVKYSYEGIRWYNADIDEVYPAGISEAVMCQANIKITYTNSTFVLTGLHDNSGNNIIYVSNDGKSWKEACFKSEDEIVRPSIKDIIVTNTAFKDSNVRLECASTKAVTENTVVEYKTNPRRINFVDNHKLYLR